MEEYVVACGLEKIQKGKILGIEVEQGKVGNIPGKPWGARRIPIKQGGGGKTRLKTTKPSPYDHRTNC